MMSKYLIKLVDNNMSQIIGFNGKPLESHFDSLSTVSLEVNYLLNQLRSPKDSDGYFLIIDSEFRNVITTQLKPSDLTLESILKSLESISD